MSDLVFNYVVDHKMCQTASSASIAVPINLTANTATPSSINISWNPVLQWNNCVTVTAYEVQYTWTLDNGQLGISYGNTTGAQTQLVLHALQDCIQYSISVRVYTNLGPGPFSTPVVGSSSNGEFVHVFKDNPFMYCMVITCSARSGSSATKNSN